MSISDAAGRQTIWKPIMSTRNYVRESEDELRLQRRRQFGVLLAAVTLVILAAFRAVPARAEDPAPSPVTRIEEDWVVRIGEPDFASTAPQISIVTTPFDSLEKPYTVFEINNVTLPDYYGGGLQLQSWVSNQNTSSINHDSLNALATTDEEVTFTIRMSIRDSRLRVRVQNGQSQTWGAFGGSQMTLSLDTTLSNLDGYDPSRSVKFSRVGYAPNRVKLLQLKAVRYYSGWNLIKTDSEARTVVSAAQ